MKAPTISQGLVTLLEKTQGSMMPASALAEGIGKTQQQIRSTIRGMIQKGQLVKTPQMGKGNLYSLPHKKEDGTTPDVITPMDLITGVLWKPTRCPA